MEEMRNQFERWANNRPVSKLIGRCERDCDGYTHAHYNALWDIWQASRSSLVVDLSDMHLLACDKKDVIEALSETGITVKGGSE